VKSIKLTVVEFEDEKIAICLEPPIPNTLGYKRTVVRVKRDIEIGQIISALQYYQSSYGKVGNTKWRLCR